LIVNPLGLAYIRYIRLLDSNPHFYDNFSKVFPHKRFFKEYGGKGAVTG